MSSGVAQHSADPTVVLLANGVTRAILSSVFVRSFYSFFCEFLLDWRLLFSIQVVFLSCHSVSSHLRGWGSGSAAAERAELVVTASTSDFATYGKAQIACEVKNISALRPLWACSTQSGTETRSVVQPSGSYSALK